MFVRIILVLVCWLTSAAAAERLTLEEAVATALRTHPRIAADTALSLAAGENVTAVRSGLYPTVGAHVSGVGAVNDSRIAAGNLNNPIILSRLGMGTSVSQLITDFGRTQDLTESSRLRAGSSREGINATRAAIVLAVHRAFLAGLRTRNLLEVAQQTIEARQLVLDQVSALASANMKSTLDVSFAEVNISEARLLLSAAENQHRAALADLSSAIGYREPRDFDLVDVPAIDQPPPPSHDLITEALTNRPELAALRMEHQAALRFVEAEKKLARPTVTALGAAGVAPAHSDRMRGRYGAVGVNLNMPVFNGHLFDARQREAAYRAQAIGKRIEDLENGIAREISVAWLNADTAFQRIALTAQLLKQSRLALDLAQERYKLGLSSIVELSQAQLNETGALIRDTAARYDYSIETAILNFQAGRLQ
ncbi:MAG: TolC family protein [Bryobacteraceae bacterium]